MKNEDILVLNSKAFVNADGEEVELSIKDSTGFVNMAAAEPDFHLPTNFYGNRVANLAKTPYKGIYLCVDKHNEVFDTLVKKAEITALQPVQLRAILQAKRIQHSSKSTKQQLLSKLGIEYIGSDAEDGLVATGGQNQLPTPPNVNNQP